MDEPSGAGTDRGRARHPLETRRRLHAGVRRSLVLLIVTASCALLAARTTEAAPAPPSVPSPQVPTSVPASAPSRPPPPGTVTPPSLADVERMCALLTGCPGLPLPAPTDAVSCVRELGGWLTRPDAVTFSLTLRECALGAKTCAEVASCALRGVPVDACHGKVEDDGKRMGPATVSFCDAGGRAVTCRQEKVAQVRDCSRGGEQCRVTAGEARCVLASAAGQASAPPTGDNTDGCDGRPDGASCSPSNRHLVTCSHGRSSSLDCGAFGLVCASGEGSDGPGCAPPTTTCTSTSDRCEGATAVRCLHGHEVRVSCGAVGLTCGGTGVEVGACRVPTFPGAPADPCGGAPATSCSGDGVTYCAANAGGMRRVSCKSVGLARCVRDAHGTRCAP